MLCLLLDLWVFSKFLHLIIFQKIFGQERYTNITPALTGPPSIHPKRNLTIPGIYIIALIGEYLKEKAYTHKVFRHISESFRFLLYSLNGLNKYLFIVSLLNG